MAGAFPPDAIHMNSFNQFAGRVRAELATNGDLAIAIDEPVTPDGSWFLSVSRSDGFMVEVEWHRHRGFGIVAGRELVFGSGVDEVYGSVDAAFDRAAQLLATGEATSNSDALDLGELRKLRGLLQKDVAERLGISKSGLAQMERPASLSSMQLDTLRKLIASLGGELVLRAQFPDGRERNIAVD
jgi:DNA-binding XRE family transcriptional regulator